MTIIGIIRSEQVNLKINFQNIILNKFDNIEEPTT